MRMTSMPTGGQAILNRYQQFQRIATTADQTPADTNPIPNRVTTEIFERSEQIKLDTKPDQVRAETFSPGGRALESFSANDDGSLIYVQFQEVEDTGYRYKASVNCNGTLTVFSENVFRLPS